jgi:Uma2 family endonuclease
MPQTLVVENPEMLERGADTSESAGPTERRWTRDEYYRLASQGYFDGQRVELIEGRIIRMSAQGLPDTQCVGLLQEYLSGVFKTGHWVRVQMPFRAADGSDPEPDLSVVQGSIRTPRTTHPTTALLIVEVADTSLKLHRAKARIYAASGIADYWIVNLLDGTIEVSRDPIAGASPTSPAYASTRLLGRNDAISPLAAPAAVVTVTDLLP